MLLDLETWNVRRRVYDGFPALTPGTARHEWARWLTVVREVSRALFPEEGAARLRPPAADGRSASRIAGDRQTAFAEADRRGVGTGRR